MGDNFQLKIRVLELDSISITMAPPTKIQSSSTQKATAAVASVIDYVTRTIDTFDVSRNDIDYRAEGNANIVLAIPQRCQVLRLPKKSKSKQNICRSTTKECYQSERIFYVYKYIDRVSTLFGRNISSSRPLLVRIEFSNVDAFDIWLHNHRPLHRIEAKNDDFDYGLLYHDACSLSLENTTNLQAYDDVLAIEIKPKQGWDICTLPDFVLQIFEINHCLRDKCRFCAMQHLKAKGRQVQRLSKYCPLDLFSGDTARMKQSIANLIVSPQNNFRVFRNGLLVYSDDQQHELSTILTPFFGNNSNIMNDFISLLVNILLYDFVTVDAISTTPENQHSPCISLNSSRLPKNSILKHVLDLQLLAKKTIPYIAQKYADNSNGWKNLIKNKHWQHSHVTTVCQKLSHIDENFVDEIDYEYLKRTCNLNDEEIYEIGATALDSSLMVSFRCIGQQIDHHFRYPLVKLNDQQFIVNATVFDLDPKLYPYHFSKYVQKTRDSFKAYKQFLDAATL